VTKGNRDLGSAVLASLSSSTRCPDCGAAADWWGVQALVGGSLRWDVGAACSVCGFSVLECGGLLPDDVRDRLLAEHGWARLRVNASASRVMIMRTLRAELGIGLVDAKAALGLILAGDYSGTLPEMELLARRLRASGVDAVASRAV
jgi:hypothetical protein